jgi:hypothetical protein
MAKDIKPGIIPASQGITEDELFEELVAAYYSPSVNDDDITAARICKAVHERGGRTAIQTIEDDMIRRALAGEFTIVIKRGKNGRDVNVYVKSS